MARISKATKDRWRTKLREFAFWAIWILGFAGLAVWDDYPDSLGAHITGHGKAGGIEMVLYSYLLVERHSLLDVALFGWMWAPVVVFLMWLFPAPLRKLSRKSFSIYADKAGEGPPAR